MESVLVGALISVIVATPISILWVHLITKQKEYNEQQKENNKNNCTKNRS